MGPTLSPETSAFKLQTPGKFPEEYELHSEHGESLKTSLFLASADNIRSYSTLYKVFTTSLGFRRHRQVLPDGFKRTRKVAPSTLGEIQFS